MRFTTLASALALTISTPLAATICNGDSSLCDRSYSNVTFIGAHDSYAVGSSVADNQDKDVTSQLNDGIRALQIQTHNESDGIHLCHTSCTLLDGGTLESYLAKVASWVSSNPNEVITLIMVNIDNLPPTSFTSAFESSGISNYAYSPSSATLALSDWPTLGSLIDQGKNVVVFIDYEANYQEVPYLIDEFSNMFEDAYDVTTTTWDCGANRTSGSPSSQLMLINHFLDTTYNFAGTQFWVPDKTQLNVTNSESSLSFHVGNCQTIWGRKPNIILLDFYDSAGNVPFNLAASLNSVAEPTNTVTPATTTATSAQTAVVSASSLSGGSGRSTSIPMISLVLAGGSGAVGSALMVMF